jgi:hypothetical protein
MAKIAATVPKHGDSYPTVRAWMQRLGTTALDIRANEVKLDHAACRVYVAAVMGPAFDLRFRVLHSSVGRGGHRYIVLDRQTRHTLGTVLHECAHAIQLTRLQEQGRGGRYDAAPEGPPRPPRARCAHRLPRQAFCRTARLLRLR